MKENKELRTKVISFRITDAQFRALENQTNDMITVNEIARLKLLGAKIIQPKDEQFNRQKMAILGRYGNNLNQIAKQLNSEMKTNQHINNNLLVEIFQKLSSLEDLIQHDLAVEIYERDAQNNGER
ncbi:TPA: plasmid mobilization protein [Photobacterium damselae]